MKRSLAFITLSTLLALCVVLSIVESEGRHQTDPSGEYTAVVTFRAYKSYIPCSPGDSSGKSGFITIFDSKGQSYGKIPVGMISQIGDLRWTDQGAYIPAYCEWDFTSGEYRYWDSTQTHETIKIIKLSEQVAAPDR